MSGVEDDGCGRSVTIAVTGGHNITGSACKEVLSYELMFPIRVSFLGSYSPEVNFPEFEAEFVLEPKETNGKLLIRYLQSRCLESRITYLTTRSYSAVAWE